MSFRPIRETDDKGALTRAGYTWFEQHDGVIAPLVGLIILAVPVFLYSLFPMMAGKLWGFVLGTCSIGLVWLCMRAMRQGGNVERSLIFQATGRIAVPRGLPDHPNETVLKARQSDVASLEVQRGSKVVLLTRSGVTITIAHKLRQDEGTLIAVQLTAALKELRDSMGSAGNRAAHDIVIN